MLIAPIVLLMVIASPDDAPSVSQQDAALWVLNQGGQIRIDGVDELLYTKAGFPKSGDSVTVRSIILRKSAVMNSDIGRFAHLNTL